MMSHSQIIHCLSVCIIIIATTNAKTIPSPAILHAPFTPFHNDAKRSLNLQPIQHVAAFSKHVGVNLVWVAGGLGQFTTLSLTERKALALEWIKYGKIHDLYVVIHVGTTVVEDAIILARHAEANGADCIASVPPYYGTGGASTQAIIDSLAPIANSVSLPFLYYHIPGTTGVDISMTEFFQLAPTSIPTLAGVKYVSSNFWDWLTLNRAHPKGKYTFMWAPEPKLTAIPLGAESVVLAEAFYAQSWLRMYKLSKEKNAILAEDEQMWKYSAMQIFSKYGGAACERYVYDRLLNVTMGPAREPSSPLSPTQITAMYNDLTTINFWEKVY